MKEKPILVSIVCCTYNHERYIAQAIEGFLMQKTDFRFEILINDDASTDSTAKIIKEYEKKYSDIIRAFYSEKNEYSQGINPGLKLYENANGKYIALCEGDDFWIDENKLQIQVDYMESHPECTICGHSAYECYENGVIKRKLFKSFNSDCEVSMEDIITRWIFPTQSILYRASARNPIIVPFKKDAPFGDLPLVIFLAHKGSAYYLEKTMCVYRRGSISSVTKYWKSGNPVTIDVYERFKTFLDRVDKYTEGMYSECILNRKIRCEYIISSSKGDIKSILFNKNYKDISLIRKAFDITRIILRGIHMWELILRMIDAVEYKICLINMKKIKCKNILILDKD